MNKKSIIATLVAFSAIGVASAEAPLQVEGSVSANAGSGDFAPYFMMANRGGTLTQPKAVELRVKALKDFDLSERFSYGFGADLVEVISRNIRSMTKPSIHRQCRGIIPTQYGCSSFMER